MLIFSNSRSSGRCRPRPHTIHIPFHSIGRAPLHAIISFVALQPSDHSPRPPSRSPRGVPPLAYECSTDPLTPACADQRTPLRLIKLSTACPYAIDAPFLHVYSRTFLRTLDPHSSLSTARSGILISTAQNRLHGAA